MKILAQNRRARFDYNITDTFIAGIVLNGAEVKSVKNGHISLKGSYATITKDELFLVNAHISPYKYAVSEPGNETRERKLLVHKKEIRRLEELKHAGQNMVILAVGLERGRVKVEVGIGRGQKKYDKRAKIKNREAERDIQRATNL